MYNIAICDDETSTCSELETMLLDYATLMSIEIEIDIWFTGRSLCEAFKKDYKVDLLFLDIELIGLNGLQVGKFIRDELNDQKTFITYISSKQSYAMSLFKIQPLDFLIKPIQKKELAEVMGRFIKLTEQGKLFFEFKNGRSLTKLPYEDIIYFSSMDRKITIVTVKEQYIFYGKIKNIVSKLTNNFLLIHQSYLINQNYVSEYAYDSVKMINGDILSISKANRVEVRKKIKLYRREFQFDNV